MKYKYIDENLAYIKENIEKACLKSNRKFEDITIIGVTKNVDLERIEYLKSLGIKNFGENKAQELLEKYEDIQNASWHFIGNLQTNKVKQIIDKVEIIHSVNSLRLLNEINKRAFEHKKIIKILLEINIANDKSKNGLNLEDIDDFVENTEIFKNIELSGLMCIAPFVEKPQYNRKYFMQMKKLFVDIYSKNKDNINMKYLSMGMTNDYEIAVEEGSNIVRIGTGIFGSRN